MIIPTAFRMINFNLKQIYSITEYKSKFYQESL